MRTIAWIASFATIFGVSTRNAVAFWCEATFWTRLLFIAVLLASVVVALVDLQYWWKNRVRRHKNTTSINKYLLKLFKRGGSLSIFANHLSWIQDAPEIRDFITEEAGKGRDICLFVPKQNNLTQTLSASGVNVHTYEDLEYEPGARFTLLNPDEPGSSLLAIGTGTVPDFYIEEFSDKTHPHVVAVARDLLKILERFE